MPGLRGLDNDKFLSAGAISATAAGAGAFTLEPSLNDGKLTYRATLPAGTIRAGVYQVAANGGADVSRSVLGDDSPVRSHHEVPARKYAARALAVPGHAGIAH